MANLGCGPHLDHKGMSLSDTCALRSPNRSWILSSFLTVLLLAVLLPAGLSAGHALPRVAATATGGVPSSSKAAGVAGAVVCEQCVKSR